MLDFLFKSIGELVAEAIWEAVSFHLDGMLRIPATRGHIILGR
jgi:hypothetical protein